MLLSQPIRSLGEYSFNLSLEHFQLFFDDLNFLFYKSNDSLRSLAFTLSFLDVYAVLGRNGWGRCACAFIDIDELIPLFFCLFLPNSSSTQQCKCSCSTNVRGWPVVDQLRCSSIVRTVSVTCRNHNWRKNANDSSLSWCWLTSHWSFKNKSVEMANLSE